MAEEQDLVGYRELVACADVASSPSMLEPTLGVK